LALSLPSYWLAVSGFFDEMSAALWNLSLAVLLGSSQALVADQYVAHTAISDLKSVSVNSVGTIAKSQNGLLRQERLEQDPVSTDVDADLKKLLGTDTNISFADLDLKTHSGADASDADLKKLIGSGSSAASDVDADLNKLQTSNADSKASDSDADMQKLMASLGQTSEAKKEESLDSLLGDLNKESKDTPALNTALGDNKDADAERQKMDALMASMDSSSNDLSTSLSQLNQLPPLQTKQGSSLLQVKDMPDDMNLALATNGKTSSDSDLEKELAQLNETDQDKQKSTSDEDLAQVQVKSDSDEDLDKAMGLLGKESKDNANLDKALKELNDDNSVANEKKNVDDMKDVTESLNELNQMKTASLLQNDDLPDQAKGTNSKWLDETLAKMGDGWHPEHDEEGSGDTDSSLTQSSQKDSSWLDAEVHKRGDKIDPAADKKWLDDELRRIQSNKQDANIVKMAQQQLSNA